MAKINPSNRIVQVTRISKHGDSTAMVLSPTVRDMVGWKLGDSIAVRIAGEKLICERVPIENFAKIRTGEVAP